ncbi:carbohydrate kinase [Deinococcus soli (ex Cha et al. 2016)]|uniref:Fructokinase n=2 Tax=Deinococcus soli (ex Cha et al. 2016) TaxID=1309411 RepID=A0AAE3X9I4_9DEIO|nr:carbohydrate kinase [Deinococcus soli (ex Cha et al. 2016)]MDR6216744.1 fructokinase [Deinococcus soli (ex Cha et al. 2016)]MDR6327565.1 fructokinase [Deinococcus soli (ex Cha et al. 2016)]MDR6749840.1 fructokinase [Deinococcus soli (ex Cha et al. 2016)]
MSLPQNDLPLIVSAGEALTDLVTAGGNAWHAHPGGAGWNVARACASLGVPSAFAGAVGQDNFGDDLRRASQDARLDLRFLQRVPAPTLLAVVYSANPPEYRFLGENSADLHFDPTLLPDGWLRAARWLHVGGISLSRWPLADTLLGLIESARAAGVRISFDPNARITHRHPDYPAVFEQVARRADLMKFSDEDLAFFFPGQSEDDVMRRLRGLNAKAPIVITRGAQGASLYHSAGRADLPAAPVQVVDTVGAGDALCAGLLVSATEHAGALWSEHLRVGLRAAAAACAHAGAYAPTRADLGLG